MSRFDAKYKYKEALILIRDIKGYAKGTKCSYILSNHISNSCHVLIDGNFIIIPMGSYTSLREYRSSVINDIE
jgi:hypothetical protein